MALVLDGSTGIVSANIADGTISANDLASGAITSSALPAGSVLQVLYSTHRSQSTTTSTSFVDFPLSINITPSSASSKILIMLAYAASVTSDNHLQVAILRDSTIVEFTNSARFAQTAGISGGHYALNYLDSPATTSTLTYKAQFKSRDSNESVDVQYQNSPSSITVMEIAA